MQAHPSDSSYTTPGAAFKLPVPSPVGTSVETLCTPNQVPFPRSLLPSLNLSQPLEWFLSGTTGALVVVAVVVIRIYLGWSYVGDRLLSAAVPYEETGW